jgi:carbonic anhydrase/acetyltransferase-like protein (isoleucine patch superfamily)
MPGVRHWLQQRRWGATLGRGTRIEVARGGRLVVGTDVTIGAGTRIAVRAGTLTIGDHARIGERCDIVVHDGVTIAPGARIESWVSITDFAPVYADPERPTRLQGLATKPVSVGERAVVDHAANLTAGATVRPGTRVAPHEVR